MKKAKQALSLLLIFSVICAGLTIFGHFTASAATFSWELVQDFESESSRANTSFMWQDNAVKTWETANPLSGDYSMKIETNVTGNDLPVVNIATTASQPAIENPRGVFFRLEASTEFDNNPFIEIYLAGNLADNPPRYILGNSEYMLFVPDTGERFTQRGVPQNFSGYVFVSYDAWVNFSDNSEGKLIDASKVTQISLVFSSVQYGGPNWGDSTVTFDNVGFFGCNADYLSAADTNMIIEEVEGRSPQFVMLEDFEDGEELSDFDLNAPSANAGAPDETELETELALSGEGSLRITSKNGGEADRVSIINLVKTLAYNPASPLIDPFHGLFFKFSTDDPDGVTLKVDFGLGAGNRMPFLVLIKESGEVTHTLNGTVPGGFSGYIFMRLSTNSEGVNDINAFLAGLGGMNLPSASIAIEGMQNGCFAFVDNVGLYNALHNSGPYPAAYFDKLLASIKEAYPDNDLGRFSYTVVQSFEGPDKRQNSGVKGGTHQGTVEYVTENALSDMYSMKITAPASFAGSGNTSSYTLKTEFSEAEHNALEKGNVKGVLFKIKTNVQAVSQIGLSLGDDYSDITFPHPGDPPNRYIILVDDNGSYSVNKGIPANFSGYVFITPLYLDFNQKLDGTKINKIELILDQRVGDWSGSVTYIDNVGLFGIKADQTQQDWIDFAADLREKYPEGYSTSSDIVQTFEDDEEASQLQSSFYGAAMSSVKVTGNALSGEKSGLIKFNPPATKDAWVFDYLVKDVAGKERFKSSLDSVTGVVMRVNTNLPAGVGININMTELELIDGGKQIKGKSLQDHAFYVSHDFQEYYVGRASMPANFNGYLFIANDTDTDPEEFENLSILTNLWYYRYENPLGDNIYFGGNKILLDNVGYFQMTGEKTIDKCIEIAREIEAQAQFKSNPEISVNEPTARFFVDTDLTPQRYLDLNIIRKLMLTAEVIELKDPNKKVQWSALPAGSAEFSETAMIPGMDTEAFSSRIVTFKDSGTVTIRVTLETNPNIYSDFTVFVEPNQSDLEELVDEALEITDYYSDDTWEALQEAIRKALELIEELKRTENQYTSQKDINDVINELQKAINKNLYGTEYIPEVNPGNEPGTVKGRLLDKNDKPVPGVKMILYAIDSSDEYSTVTDSGGNFEFKNVPAGEYGMCIIGPDGEEIQCDLQITVTQALVMTVNARYNGANFETGGDSIPNANTGVSKPAAAIWSTVIFFALTGISIRKKQKHKARE